MLVRFPRRPSPTVSVWALCLAAGCGFEPGHDYAVTATWLINGLAPTPELCAAYGIANVRLTVSTPGADRVLEAPCTNLVGIWDEAYGDYVDYGGFVTTEAFDYSVIYGYTLEMLDAGGKRLEGLWYKDNFQAYYSDPIPLVLAPLELLAPEGDEVSVSAAWSVAGADLEQGCSELGIETVALWVTSRTDLLFDDALEIAAAPCSDGAYASEGPVLALGHYLMKYVAFDPRGAVVEEGQAIEVLSDQPGDVLLSRARFGAN